MNNAIKVTETTLVTEWDDLIIQGHEQDIVMIGAALELETEAKNLAGYYVSDGRDEDGMTFEYDRDAVNDYVRDNRVDFAQRWIDTGRQIEIVTF